MYTIQHPAHSHHSALDCVDVRFDYAFNSEEDFVRGRDGVAAAEEALANRDSLLRERTRAACSFGLGGRTRADRRTEVRPRASERAGESRWMRTERD